jgi:hypothetical protein
VRVTAVPPEVIADPEVATLQAGPDPVARDDKAS